MKTKRKLSVIALTLALVFTMIPMYTGAAFAAATQVLKIGGVSLLPESTGETVYATTTNDGTVTKVEDSSTPTDNFVKVERTASGCKITLHNATITGAAVVSNYNCAIFSYYIDQLEITLEGTNTVTGGNAQSGTSYGMYAFGTGATSTTNLVTISGDGTLNATGGAAPNSRGIHIDNASLLISGGTINAIADATDATSSLSYGIYSWNNVEIGGSSKVTAKGKNAGIKTNSALTVNGGEVNAIGQENNNGNSVGLEAFNISINSGTVNASGGSSTTGNSYGIDVERAINISGGTITATGGDIVTAGKAIYGIKAADGGISISGGTGTASAVATGNASVTASAFGVAPNCSDAIQMTGNWNDASATWDAAPVTNYGVWVAGTRVTSANASDVLGSADTGETVIYTPANGSTPQILTLSGAAISTSTSEDAISTAQELIIEVVGNNTVTGGNTTDKSCGIFVNGAKLTLQGSGTLTASGSTLTDGKSYGIAASNLEVKGSVNLNANGGSITASNSSLPYSRGIDVATKITFNGTGTVTATGNQITGGTASESGGIACGEIVINFGTIIAEGNNYAMKGTLNTSAYTNALITKSASIDGNPSTSESAFSGNILDYKYIKVERGTTVDPSPTNPPSGGGSYRPSTPIITVDSDGNGSADNAGGTAAFDKTTGKVIITPAEGYQVAEVIVNGESKGKTTELSDIKATDTIKITFEKKPAEPEKTPEQIAAERQAKLASGVKTTRVVYPKAVNQSNGKVKLTWKKTKGYKVDYYIVYRSDKKDSGFKQVFKSRTLRYITSKNLKSGNTIYFKIVGARTVGDKVVKTKMSRVEAVKIK